MAYATQDQLGAYTTVAFDPVGNTVLRTDARGWPMTVTVDALNRVTGKLYLDGTRHTFTFDAAGRQTTMQDVTGITTYTLDAVGQRTNVLDFMGTPITYQFDPAGNRTYMKDPPGHYWTYTLDPDGRLAAVWNSYGQFTTLAHDPLGRETQRVLANGVNIQRTFDPAGRETVLSELKPDGSALQVYTASYDPTGNRLTVQEYDGTLVTYTHDAAYQLTREQRGGAHAFDTSLEYDAAGNRISKVDATGTTGYQHNAANELVLTTPPAGAPTTSTWDANGNLAVEITGAQRTSYTWDGENHLSRIDLPNGTNEQNAYHADGLRQKHTDTGGTETLYVLDEQNVLLETGGAGAIYTQLPGIWGGAFSYKRGADHFYLLPDLQGHTRLRLSAAPAVIEEIIYSAWGGEEWIWGNHTNYLKAFGQWRYWKDAASRLYVRARQLRVDQGRWVSRDPLGLDGGDWNLYRYVAGRPLVLGDPSGRVIGCSPDDSPPGPRGQAWECTPVLGPVDGRGQRIVPPSDCARRVCQAVTEMRETIDGFGNALCAGTHMGAGAAAVCLATMLCIGQHGGNCDIDPPRDTPCWVDDTGGWGFRACCNRCMQCVCTAYRIPKCAAVYMWMRAAFQACAAHGSPGPRPDVGVRCTRPTSGLGPRHPKAARPWPFLPI